jgi:hypothetical protein
MASWTHQGIEWFYDDDLDTSSWKANFQLDEGFRLPTVQEVLTLISYTRKPRLPEDCPFRSCRLIWTGDLFLERPDKAMAIDTVTGAVYPSSFANNKLLLLVRK